MKAEFIINSFIIIIIRPIDISQLLDFHPLPPPLFTPSTDFFIAHYFCQLQNLKVEFAVGVIYFVRKL